MSRDEEARKLRIRLREKEAELDGLQKECDAILGRLVDLQLEKKMRDEGAE